MTSYGNYGMKLTKSNHLYRNTKVGVAMFDSIQELFEMKKLTPQQALIIVTQFDNSVRKIMNKKIKENHCFFSFEAEVKTYRLQSGWCSVILENVAVYQHFRTSEIQWWYKCEQERRKKEGEKTKYLKKKYCDRFKNRSRNNDVKVLCQEVSELHLIGKKFCVDISATGLSDDFKKIGKCRVLELRGHSNPRIAFFRLQRQVDQNGSVKDPEDEDTGSVPMLNRFKNSTFFSEQTDSIKAETEKYYNRRITRDPNSKQLMTFVHTFDTRKNLEPKSIAKEPPTPSHTLPKRESKRESKGCYILRTRDPTGYFKNRKTM